MNRLWFLGCSVAIALWIFGSWVVLFFGMVFGPNYPLDAGIGMLAFAVVAPSALRLIRSYRLRRVGAVDGVAIALLLPALTLVAWSIQQVASPRPAYPFTFHAADPFRVFGIVIGVGIVLILIGAIARRSREYGNRLRFASVGIGCVTIIAALVGWYFVLINY